MLSFDPMNWDWLRNLLGQQPQAEPDPLGPRGENAAAKYLRGLGYRILVRNYRCKVGEIDIVARDGKTLVFVEVKTRAADEPEPEEQVNAHKQRQISRCADIYLSRYSNVQPAARFDIVAIVWPRHGTPTIRHHLDAFASTI